MATQHDQSRTHVHGQMNIREQQRTFDGFVRFMTWAAILSCAVLAFMALSNA